MLQTNELFTLCTSRVHARSASKKPFEINVFTIASSLILFIVVNIFFTACALEKPQPFLTSQKKEIAVEGSLDINSAGVAELEKLPRIGPKMAAKIIRHRERFGRFRKPEELMMVDGFSESRFLIIRGLVRAD